MPRSNVVPLRAWRWAVPLLSLALFSLNAQARRPSCHRSMGQNVCGYRCLKAHDGSWSCADTPDGVCVRGPTGLVACTRMATSRPEEGSPSNRKADCILDRDGAACGFDCLKGSDGHAACASTPGGSCLLQHGTATCTESGKGPWLVSMHGQADCMLGRDGAVACGYDCLLGSNGQANCATTPDGACIKDKAGHVTCTTFPVESRIVALGEVEKAECFVGTDGHAVCGYGCARNPKGQVKCANTPDGACAQDRSGGIVCTAFDPSTRVIAHAAGIKQECHVGSDGIPACGYGCLENKRGHLVCYAAPEVACLKGTDGEVVCSLAE